MDKIIFKSSEHPVKMEEITSDKDKKLRQRVLRFDGWSVHSIKVTDVILVIDSKDMVTLQAHVTSPHNRTDEKHFKIKIEGFNKIGIRTFTWTSKDFGVVCGQNDVQQERKYIPNSYDAYAISYDPLEMYIVNC